MTNYKKLEAWTISMETIKEIYDITRLYPREERYGLISQTRLELEMKHSNTKWSY